MRNGSCRKKMNNPNAGFTLLEVVLSIAILAVVSLPLLRYFLESLRYSTMMSKEQQAVFLAQEITEGLLAEHRLVTVSGNGTAAVEYSIPFFDSMTSAEGVTGGYSSSGLIVNGTGEVVYEATLAYGDDGENRYYVEVTVKTPGEVGDVSLDDMLDLRGYGIYSDTDVMYTDSGENDRAVLEFLGINYTYCLQHRDDEVPPVMRDETYIRNNMRREIYVDLSVDDDDNYQIVIYYLYYCPGIEGGEDMPPTVWPEAINSDTNPEKVQVLVVVNRTMKELRNIYLLYDRCKGGDTVILGSPFKDAAGRKDDVGQVVSKFVTSPEGSYTLGLNIVYQDGMDSGDLTAESGVRYKLTVNRDSFEGNLSLYTNVDGEANGDLIGTNKFPLNAYDTKTEKSLFLGEGEPALVYDIVTRVYPADRKDGTEPLVEIETKKGE